ncbi:alpha/beta hydrolase [Bacillus taeanensis]|uniref:Esterase family protein n=1 Tax=Bacillus taeanensis TaxID=273032 RepID=A0A366XV14_9BACI|nr:alpha/beta hydrolase-fold protein [Bacillus taeanensis]RBW69972.1 esterase family protein [Bacillus taeanensis]
MEKGRTEETTIYSERLGEEITIMVYLPPNYSTFLTYPVLIAQDGKDYFQLGRIASTTDRLINEEKVRAFIIVAIPYKSVEDRRRKYHPDGSQNQEYIEFLAEELLPFINQTYAVESIGTERTLIGDSLGATVSLLTALTYPHTFSNVIMQSPYVDETVINKVKNSHTSASLSIYHVIGMKETAVKTTNHSTKDFLTPNRELKAVINKKEFHYFYEEFEGDHTWKYWQPDLKRALELHYLK